MPSERELAHKPTTMLRNGRYLQQQQSDCGFRVIPHRRRRRRANDLQCMLNYSLSAVSWQRGGRSEGGAAKALSISQTHRHSSRRCKHASLAASVASATVNRTESKTLGPRIANAGRRLAQRALIIWCTPCTIGKLPRPITHCGMCIKYV